MVEYVISVGAPGRVLLLVKHSRGPDKTPSLPPLVNKLHLNMAPLHFEKEDLLGLSLHATPLFFAPRGVGRHLSIMSLHDMAQHMLAFGWTDVMD